jgi:hypothetical protein
MVTTAQSAVNLHRTGALVWSKSGLNVDGTKRAEVTQNGADGQPGFGTRLVIMHSKRLTMETVGIPGPGSREAHEHVPAPAEFAHLSTSPTGGDFLPRSALGNPVSRPALFRISAAQFSAARGLVIGANRDRHLRLMFVRPTRPRRP